MIFNGALKNEFEEKFWVFECLKSCEISFEIEKIIKLKNIHSHQEIQADSLNFEWSRSKKISSYKFHRHLEIQADSSNFDWFISKKVSST